MSEISLSMLEEFSGAFRADPANVIRRNAVVKNGLPAAAETQREEIDNPMVFSVELETGKITNQKASGRCWLFAALNTMRFEIMKKLDLETFELSQNYQMFYDKLEKANFFLDSIVQTASLEVDSRLVKHLLANPMQDGGQWDMYCALAQKYGVVPKAVMPETWHSSNTRMMCKFLELKLREDAMLLRKAVAAGEDTEEMKRGMLCEIYRILVICLGEPPKTFTFEYRDKEKNFHRDEDITPLRFFEKYVGLDLDEYVSVINAPTKDKPYGRTFTVEYLGNVVGGRPVKYLNLPSGELKRLAIAQLQDGRPVWFGCDVGQMLTRESGIMGMHTYDYEALMGVRFGLDKAERLDYSESMMTHAMVFLGVNLVDGKPNRWKVENSWGDKSGQDGYYIMTDEWFDEYNYQIVVDRKYLTEEQKAQFAQEPIALRPWDPMGSLA
ncbi:MAG: C1 family peptidase [Clostridia bacterium]|nr:C1 family peptidase [Clostridia bacterium]